MGLPKLRFMENKIVRLVCVYGFVVVSLSSVCGAPIDRHALVTRHDVVLHQFDAKNPLSVGNGEFAFTVDATGLQTFPEAFAKGINLGTMAQWAWHTTPTTKPVD